MKHLSNWVEIPVTDMARATAFYEKVLQEMLQPMELGPVQYALFPAEDRFNCGALAQGEGYEPGPGGVTVYLDGGEDLDIRPLPSEEGGRHRRPAQDLPGKGRGPHRALPGLRRQPHRAAEPMTYYYLRLNPPRPTFSQDMTP